MATLIEDARFKLQSTIKDREKFAAEVFAKDGGPNEDDERKLDAMLNGEADIRSEVARLEKFEKAQTSGGQHPQTEEIRNPAKSTGRKIITLGEAMIASDAYKAALKAHAPNGVIGGKFQMDAIDFKLAQMGIHLGMQAALVTGESSTSAGAFVITDRDPELVGLGRRPLNIFDFIRMLTTESDLVDYVAQTSRTNGARAIVPEATATGDGLGAAPESAAAFVVRQAAVQAISNFMPATKRSVADVPQMRDTINTELRDNVREAFENLVFNGGSGIIGMLQTSGRQSQAWSTNILTTTRKAKTIVWTVGRVQPEAYILNPSDWETIDLLQDNEARYFYGGPSQVGIPRLWGEPVVEAESVAQGTGIVGALSKFKAWMREEATLSMTDSHSDWFTRGIIAVLVEMRAAAALTQPNAIVEIDLTA